MTSTSHTRRRLDPEERRATILAAAARQFAAHPYADVSLARVGAEAGASEALVHKYFATKAVLYTEVLAGALGDLAHRTAAADAALPPHTSTRDRVRTSLLVFLDHVAEHPTGWASPFHSDARDPEPAREVRRAARAAYVDALASALRPDPAPRRRYAVSAFYGFLEAASRMWVDAGCPDADRHPLVEATLGALEGALGDWG